MARRVFVIVGEHFGFQLARVAVIIHGAGCRRCREILERSKGSVVWSFPSAFRSAVLRHVARDTYDERALDESCGMAGLGSQLNAAARCMVVGSVLVLAVPPA